jgi:hypothetical protein
VRSNTLHLFDRNLPMVDPGQNSQFWVRNVEIDYDLHQDRIVSSEAPDMISIRHRGAFMLAICAFFTITFLVGGGVVASTNGGYWTMVFLVGFVLGLACAGPFVYRSAKATSDQYNQHGPRKVSYLGSVVMGLTFPLSLAFFRSSLFASNLVQHIFVFGMGLSLSLLVPLGLGFLYADEKQMPALDLTAEPASSNNASPPA